MVLPYSIGSLLVRKPPAPSGVRAKGPFFTSRRAAARGIRSHALENGVTLSIASTAIGEELEARSMAGPVSLKLVQLMSDMPAPTLGSHLVTAPGVGEAGMQAQFAHQGTHERR